MNRRIIQLPSRLSSFKIPFIGHDKYLSFLDVPDGFVRVDVFYETAVTEIKSESFLVDFGVLVSSVGGNLGLFLGFSCYTTLAKILDFIFEKIPN